MAIETPPNENPPNGDPPNGNPRNGHSAAEQEEVPECFFEGGGSRYRATILARGPWDPNAAHGGPVAALIAREVDLFDPDPELATVRLTIELLRPVPIGELELVPELLRPGKRVRLVGVSVRHNGVEVTRAVALRIRRTPADAPRVVGLSDGLTPPELSEEHVGLVLDRIGILQGVEMRTGKGSSSRLGPAGVWFRVHKPLVNDEEITPATRAMVAADFCNGISSVVPFEKFVFINPDLTVNLVREPGGEWVYNDAATTMVPDGAALAEGRLGDLTGEIGSATQNLYVAAR